MPVSNLPERYFRAVYFLIVPIFILFLSVPYVKADDRPTRSDIHKTIQYADSLLSVQKIDSAIVIASGALSEAIRIFGENDTTTARIHHRLGVYYYLLAEYSDADKHWQRALDTRKSILGERHADVAIILNNMANLYWNQGRYEDSEKTYLRAIEIWSEALGPNHPDNALSIDGLATLYWSEGRYAEAESLFFKALRIRENAYGTDHMEVATTLNNLAILYDDQGKYDKTEKMYLRALDIWEKTLGENHPNVATTLNNLAVLYSLRGMYSKVEEYHKRALAIRINAFGENHPDVAYSMNNLAVLYWAQNRIDEAEQLYRRAIAIWRKIDPEHPEYARSLSNLADIIRDRGEYDSALVMMNRALEIREKSLSSDHPDVALSLDNLINLNMDLGNYDQALVLHDRAIAIREKSLGNDHPALAWNLNGKARIYAFLGRYSEALPLYKMALAIREKTFSPEHPDVIESELDLARLYGCMHMADISEVFFSKALESRRYFIENVFNHAKKKKKLRYINSYPLLDYSVLSFALKYDSPTHINTAFKMILSSKAAVIDAVSTEKKIAFCTDDENLKELMIRRSETIEEIANLSIAGISFRDEDLYHSRLKDLYGIKDSLEADLSATCFELKENLISEPYEINDISESLPPNSILLEYVKYKPYDFDYVGSDKEKYGAFRYLVFVQKRNGTPSIHDLGDAGVIDSLIRESREMIYNAGHDVYTMGDSMLVEKLNTVTTRLQDIIFEPVGADIIAENYIFISPDGQLNLIPFEILTNDAGRYLIEKYRISYLTSGRDLFKFQKEKKYSDEAVIIADPDFDYSPDLKSGILDKKHDVKESMSYSYLPQRGAGDCLDKKFDPIPYTKLEARNIAATLKNSGNMNVSEYYSRDADELRLKEMSFSPRILHLSTHGFFCRDDHQALENPLLKSGLVFSGANVTIDNPAEDRQIDDGILTALEVTAFNLDSTELVTLSACETGIGDVKIGEGVYGLRRAFQYAGADAIMLSLWRVPDRETSELMEGFYGKWLSGESKIDALRESILNSLNSRRKKYHAAHPYFWGAFILQGNIN